MKKKKKSNRVLLKVVHTARFKYTLWINAMVDNLNAQCEPRFTYYIAILIYLISAIMWRPINTLR